MANFNINFISNNIKGLQLNKKRAKVFEYFKRKIGPSGILFLQETHSSKEAEVKWSDEFQGQMFFSHGKTNSCGVLTAFYGLQNLSVNKTVSDNSGRILILDTKIDDYMFLFINFYNANTEKEQIQTITTLTNLLKEFDLTDRYLIFAGDFNFFHDKNPKASGGNPKIKKASIAKLIELKETYNLCDIWRIRNTKKRCYTFRQNHATGLIQRRLDYIFVSSSLQEYVKTTDTLNAFSTDHSPVFCSFSLYDEFKKGKGFWKFNNSLITNTAFVEQMNTFIQDVKNEFSNDLSYLNSQAKWEYLKYQIRKFSMTFSKNLAKEGKQTQIELEDEIKLLEENLNDNLEDYNKCKNDLDFLYDNITAGIKIKSRCSWYEHREKSSNSS